MKYLHLASLGMRQNQILSPISFVDFVASLQRKVHRTQASTPLANCHVVPTALPVKRRPLSICSRNPFDAKHLKYAKCCVWIASRSEFRWKMFINKSDLAKFCLFPNFSLPTAYGVCRMEEELCRRAVRKDVKRIRGSKHLEAGHWERMPRRQHAVWVVEISSSNFQMGIY